MTTGDVDIDVTDRDRLLSLIEHVPAMLLKDGRSRPHPSGIYLQRISQDPVTRLAALDYERAEDAGYFKIDILTASVYDGVRNEEHLVELMCRPPCWEILQVPRFLQEQQIWQISHHGKLAAKMKPRSVEELAMLLAIIRPAKRHLQNLEWAEIAKDVWVRPTAAQLAKSFFKRPHAISYAVAIVVQVNRLLEERPALRAEYGVA